MPPSPSEPEAAPPRRVLPILLIAQFAGTSLWFATNAVMPDLEALYGWPAQTAASLTSLLQLGFILGTLCFAVLAVADRHPPRTVFLICCLLGAGCTLASWWWIEHLALQRVLRVASGFCLAGIYPVGMKIASQWYRGRMGSALGWLVGALILGSAAAHGLRALVAAGFGWDGPLVLPAIALLVAAGGVLQYLALPDAPLTRAARGVAVAHRFDWAALGTLWSDRRVRASVFAYFGHMWELYTMWVAVPMLLATRIDGPQASLAAFVILGSGAVSCAWGGVMSRRWGSARVGGAFLACSGLCALAAPIMASAGAVAFFLWLLLWGLSVSADSPQFSALTAGNAPAHAVGSVLTLTNCLGFTLSIISIELFSMLLNHLPMPWLLMSLAIGPALGLWMLRPLLGLTRPPSA